MTHGMFANRLVNPRGLPVNWFLREVIMVNFYLRVDDNPKSTCKIY